MENYLEFFGFKEEPFKLTPDVNYFFTSEVHQKAFEYLEYFLKSEEGFAVLIGEPGTGKTITLRKFISTFREEAEFAYILFPRLSPEELFKYILQDFGVDTSREEDKNTLFLKLKDLLIDLRKRNKKAVVIVDEAQDIPDETLEELRLLSNLETDDMKLLQIVLAGQPELEKKLNSPKFQQLKQRVTIYLKLQPLSKEEVVQYVYYRFKKAGGDRVSITNSALNLLYKFSKGIPRLINAIMERALMAAYLDKSFTINEKHIKKAFESLEIFKENKGNRKVKQLLLSSFFLFLFTFTIFIYLEKHSSQKNNSLNQIIAQENRKALSAVIAVPMLNVREKPSRKAKIVYVLRKGEKVRVVEKGEFPWIKVKIETENGEIVGWINSKYVNFGD
ncbi:MAG: general secretion pathway protein [Aquifex sp.]|nr:MAG: general secretion pathway protein [Aquifex sp.]